MPDLETVVRPFQSPSNFSQSYPAAAGTSDGDEFVTLEFGKDNAGIRSLAGNYSATQSKYMDQKAKEHSRDVSVKRITNPQDANQWVDVEVIDVLTAKTGSGPQYQKTKHKYDNSNVGH